MLTRLPKSWGRQYQRADGTRDAPESSSFLQNSTETLLLGKTYLPKRSGRPDSLQSKGGAMTCLRRMEFLNLTYGSLNDPSIADSLALPITPDRFGNVSEDRFDPLGFRFPRSFQNFKLSIALQCVLENVLVARVLIDLLTNDAADPRMGWVRVLCCT